MQLKNFQDCKFLNIAEADIDFNKKLNLKIFLLQTYAQIQYQLEGC